MRRSDQRRTRIVATLGPASATRASIRRLVAAGVDVVRLNFSHGTRAFHQQLFEDVRAVCAALGTPVAVLQDLSGPKMRVGRLADDAVRLVSGREVEVSEGRGVGTAERLTVEASGAIKRLDAGDVIRLADGLIELRVLGRSTGGVNCGIVHGGTLRSRQGVNLPGADLGLHALTAKDKADLAFGLDLGVDAVALSFVRDADDLLQLRRVIQRKGPARPFVVAKIERAQALDHLDDILDVASGVMVARGDLGVEIGFAKVPAAQRRIVSEARRAQKPVITATQILESMIERPTPTRAEVSDIATAVMEGTDALMLSGETAVGKHPLEAVAMLESVAVETERSMLETRSWERVDAGGTDVAHSVCRAARVVARSIDAAAVLAFTEGGRTARLMSSQRVARRVFGFTPKEHTLRRMRLFWGIIPVLMARADSVEQMITDAEELLVRRRLVRHGERVVIVCGQLMLEGATNSIHVHTVGGATRRRGQPARK